MTVSVVAPKNNSFYFKIAVIIIFVVAFIVFSTKYCRDQKKETEEIDEIDSEYKEMLIQTLNLTSIYHGIIRENQTLLFNRTGREKRSVDIMAYRQMGWSLSPEEAKLVFQAYYTCIFHRNRDIAAKPHITALLGLEETTISMTCNVCFRPDQDSSSYVIEWQHLRSQDGVMRYVEENDRTKISGTKTLTIMGLDIIDAGQYYCVQMTNKEYIEIYQLDVILAERTHIVPENNKTQLLPTFNLKENNLQVFTLWSEWSNCNECNKLGKRRKIGICMVTKINPKVAVMPVDMPIMVMYPYGVPCRSTVLHEDIRQISRIKFRMSETIMGNCFMKCPTTPAFITITDKTGRIIETIDAGYFQLSKRPTLPPLIHRKTIYTTTGEKLVIKCMNTNQKKNMLRWQNGTTPLNPQTIRRQTRGRVRIDHTNRLHIQGLRLTDSAIYSCWLMGKLAATTKVVVTKALNPNVHFIITCVGVGLTVLCVTVTCICVIANQISNRRAAA